MERKLNKWQYGFKVGKCPPWRRGFYPYIRVYFLKFISFPAEGEMFSKENYHGFHWEWNMLGNIIVTRRTFVLPIRLRIFLRVLGINTRAVYHIPVWIGYWRNKK